MSANNVFILGSGFSASMGLPTLYNLFEKVMGHPERTGECDKKNVLTGLNFLYPHFNANGLCCSYPSYEEFLSIVVAAKDFSSDEPSAAFDPGFWQDIEKSAIRLLCDYIAYESSEAEENSLLNHFADNLQSGDVVITFN